MALRLRCFLAVLSLATGLACSTSAPPTLLISATTDFRASLEAALALYEGSNPSAHIVASYGGTGAAEHMVRFGAPVDLVLTAFTPLMDSLVGRGVVLGSTRTALASDGLALVTPSQRAPLSGVHDLRLPVVSRIAMSDPERVSDGRYARQALDHMGLSAELGPKFVYTEDAVQTLSLVRSNLVDAGFIHASGIHTTPAVRLLSLFPDSLHDPFVYEGAIIVSSPRKDEASRLLRFLRSDTVQSLFASKGLRRISS